MTPQHMHALEMANEIRRGGATFIAEIRGLPPREAARVVADVFEHDHNDRVLGAMRVRRLVEAVPYLHETSIAKLLVLAACSKAHDRRLRDLTPRQRTIFAIQLRLWDGHGVDDER